MHVCLCVYVCPHRENEETDGEEMVSLLQRGEREVPMSGAGELSGSHGSRVLPVVSVWALPQSAPASGRGPWEGAAARHMTKGL